MNQHVKQNKTEKEKMIVLITESKGNESEQRLKGEGEQECRYEI